MVHDSQQQGRHREKGFGTITQGLLVRTPDVRGNFPPNRMNANLAAAVAFDTTLRGPIHSSP